MKTVEKVSLAGLPQPLADAEVGRLRLLWLEGLESGLSATLDIDTIKRKARARLGSNRSPEQSR